MALPRDMNQWWQQARTDELEESMITELSKLYGESLIIARYAPQEQQGDKAYAVKFAEDTWCSRLSIALGKVIDYTARVAKAPVRRAAALLGLAVDAMD
ncbi:hypothetical protein QFC21_006836 [Naganishia friedmannii]|uniref:Uncharacterized protein n=1 Tax=Naganishia friedmannii TaxID=89922 RepID=A0ACC2UZG0_9TREE|nr:hypothetical protein QFC21_006836 [Naganishia friedmannii]